MTGRMRVVFALVRFATLVATLSLYCPVASARDNFAHTLACAADAQFPPFTFQRAVTTAPMDNNRDAAIGVTVDLISNLLEEAHMPPLKVDLLPWQRCLSYVANGDYVIALNAPTAQVNPAPYLISVPYVRLESVYVYSVLTFPKGPNISQLDDLQNFRVCGLLGNTFDAYGFGSLFVDTGATTYRQVFAKLRNNYCQIVLEKRQVLENLKLIDPGLADITHDGTLRIKAVPEEEAPGLHVLVSRKAPNAQQLLSILNTGIQHKQGTAIKTLMRAYSQR